ncbi:unnamed protein product, partial [Enterobius vermicularis]|uniref:Uncharacterized protein n=1 Tax=Enterobius vermicularis TaxID=51028 RepID=A0A0N4VHL2_ENTVE
MEDHPTIVLDIKSGYRINELAALQGNGSLISDKKKRALFSMHRPHQRSRSVGNVTVYGVGAIPSTSTVKEKTSAFTLNRSSSNRTHGSLNAIAATKRFLKMLYDSATINSRLRSKNSSSEITPSTALPFQAPKPFFEIRYTTDAHDQENLETEFNS